jgi:hypothetical protein
MKRRSPLDPESSRTLIVLVLTFSPELTLESDILAQSECAFLLFSSKLVQLSSNFFNLGANFFGIQYPAFFSEKGFLIRGYFPPENWYFLLLGEKASHSCNQRFATCFFFAKNAHHRDHCSHLTAFCSFDCNFISPRSFTGGCIGDFNQTGLSR